MPPPMILKYFQTIVYSRLVYKGEKRSIWASIRICCSISIGRGPFATNREAARHSDHQVGYSRHSRCHILLCIQWITSSTASNKRAVHASCIIRHLMDDEPKLDRSPTYGLGVSLGLGREDLQGISRFLSWLFFSFLFFSDLYVGINP